MMENGKARARRQLTPEEKWEIFLEVTSQEISQADAARKYGVDVSVIIRLRALAKDAALAAFASAKPGLLAWEEQAILDLIEQWGWVDRSHRKLAHRGSYTGAVFVSPSTLLRVALKHRVELPGEPFRPRPGKPAMPELPWERN